MVQFPIAWVGWGQLKRAVIIHSYYSSVSAYNFCYSYECGDLNLNSFYEDTDGFMLLAKEAMAPPGTNKTRRPQTKGFFFFF